MGNGAGPGAVDAVTEIGGFFGLELTDGEELHTGALRLNSGRNALEYLLRNRTYRLLHVPYYCCDSVLDGIRRAGIAVRHYGLDERFQPRFDGRLGPDEGRLYINYFGLAGATVRVLAADGSRLIVDNCQALFAPRLSGVDTFYSPRKFVGVADGAYLYADGAGPGPAETDVSFERYGYALKRWDLGARAGYAAFQAHETAMDGIPVARMSRLTQHILAAIDYERIKARRRENFQCLHRLLGDMNRFDWELGDDEVPMVYPLLIRDGGLRERLIRRDIFVATYWREVKGRAAPGSVEADLVDHLLALPIDQRYGVEAMTYMAEVVRAEARHG